MATKMLCRNLTLSEQLTLANMTQHAGFAVLIKMLDEYCTLAAAEPIKLDPTDERYDENVKRLTIIARITNEVVDSIRKSVNTHVSSAVAEQQRQELEEIEDQELDKIMGTIHLLSRRDNAQ